MRNGTWPFATAITPSAVPAMKRSMGFFLGSGSIRPVECSAMMMGRMPSAYATSRPTTAVEKPRMTIARMRWRRQACR